MILSALVGTCTVASHAIVRTDITLHEQFDRTSTNAISAEPHAASSSWTLRSGLRGTAVEMTSQIEYAAEDVIMSEGTLCFWVQPLGWSSGDGHSHHLVGICSQEQLHWIFATHYSATQLYQRLWDDSGGRVEYVADVYEAPFRDGQWRFVALTWNRRRMELYMNAVPLGALESPFIAIVPSKDMRLIVYKGANLIDELMVFNRDLTSDEIRGIYYRLARDTTSGGPVEDTQVTDSGEKQDVANGRSECVSAYICDDGVGCIPACDGGFVAGSDTDVQLPGPWGGCGRVCGRWPGVAWFAGDAGGWHTWPGPAGK